MYHITFAPQTNRSSWLFIGIITDLEDVPIDLTGCTLTFRIFSPDECDSLVASTGNGRLTIVDLGVFRWFFTLQEMQGLRPIQYNTGFTITNDDGSQTLQLSVGPLNITDGVVARL